MKKLFTFILLLWAVAAFGQASNVGPGHPVPQSFFSAYLNTITDPWPTAIDANAHSAYQRTWDSPPEALWIVLEPSRGSWAVTNLDNQLNKIRTNSATGALGVFFTGGRLPSWASSYISGVDTPCSRYEVYSCYLPIDIDTSAACNSVTIDNATWTVATGFNCRWREYVTAFAHHILNYNTTNNSNVKVIWETWNEPNGAGTYYSTGDQAHLVQMMADTCALVRSIDAAHQFCSTPSPQASSTPTWLQTFFTTANPHGTGTGASWPDYVTLHPYASSNPEGVKPIIDGVEADSGYPAGMPLYSTEYYWIGGLCDPSGQAGFLARSHLIGWSEGFSGMDWYTWDNGGALWRSGTQTCGTTTFAAGEHPAGVAYGRIQKWMVGNTLTAKCVTVSNTYTCDFTGPSNYRAQAVWNTAQSFTSTIPYTLPSWVGGTKGGDYQTLLGGGAKVSLAGLTTVAIGYSPIWIENTVTAATTVLVAPSSASINVNTTQQFTATVTGNANTAVTWYVDNIQSGNSTVGTISSNQHNVVLTWNASTTTGATYNVYRGASCPPAQSAPIASGLSNLTYTDAAVVDGTTYAYAVSALTATLGESVESNCVSVQIPTTSLSDTALYTAPAVAGTHTVKATSQADITASSTASVVVVDPAAIAVTISPTSASLVAAGQQQFTATVTGTSNIAVTWLVDNITGGNTSVGTISSSGLYTAPLLAGTHVVKVISVQNTSKFATANVTVTSSGGSIIPTTTLAIQTGNNTSASSYFTSVSDGDLGATNVSKEDVHNLLYTGNTTYIASNLNLWFKQCTFDASGHPTNLMNGTLCGTHQQVGYNTYDTIGTQLNAIFTDMESRGYDGVSLDWFGQRDASQNTTTLKAVSNLTTRWNAGDHSFTFLLNLDKEVTTSCGGTAFTGLGYANITACVYGEIDRDLDYANTNLFNSPATHKSGTHPVVLIGIHEGDAALTGTNWTTVWDTVKAHIATESNGVPYLVFQNGFGHIDSDGGYGWVNNLSNFTNLDDEGLTFLDNFYTAAVASSSPQKWGASWKGLNDTLLSSGSNHIMNQHCGHTWLDTFAEVTHGGLYGTANQLPNLLTVTWSNYEEGTEVESGIDSCNSVNTPTLSSKIVSWSKGGSGFTDTIDHWTVYVSSDKSGLQVLQDNIPPSTLSINLSLYSLPSTQFYVYVKLVSKSHIRNSMSSSLTINAAADIAPTAAITALPLTGTAPLTVLADTSGSNDPDGTIASRSINWGDGSVSQITGSPSFPLDTNAWGLVINDQTNFTNLDLNFGFEGDISGCTWPDIETSRGVYSWACLDTAIANVNTKLGMYFLFETQWVPSWATSDATSCSGSKCTAPPNDLSSLSTCQTTIGSGTSVPTTTDCSAKEFYTALVKRYKGQIDAYSCWHEANDSSNWTGSVSQLASLCGDLYTVTKQIDPLPVFLTPSVSSIGTNSYAPYFVNWLQQYLIAGGSNVADGVSWHGYLADATSSIAPMPDNGKTLSGVCSIASNLNTSKCPGSIQAQYAALRAVMNANGMINKFLWDTTGGWGLDTQLPNQDDQAAFLARWYVIQLSLIAKPTSGGATGGGGGLNLIVPSLIWNGWDDQVFGTLYCTASSSTNGCGTVGPFPYLNKAGTAYKQVYNWLVGASPRGACQLLGTVMECGYDRSNGYQSLVLWDTSVSSSSTKPFAVPAGYVQYKDLNGNITAVAAGATIQLGQKPIMLEQPTGAPNVAATHIYNLPGTFTITGTVVDNGGLSATATTSVQVTALGMGNSAQFTLLADGEFVYSPLRIQGIVSATTNPPLTHVRIYVDEVVVYDVSPGLASYNIDKYVFMSEGAYHTVRLEGTDSLATPNVFTSTTLNLFCNGHVF